MSRDGSNDKTAPSQGSPLGPDWARLRAALEAVIDLEQGDQDRALAAQLAAHPELLTEAKRMLQAERQSDPRLEPLRRPVPAQLGPWRLGELLGTGGMGQVYRAERTDGAFEREVAVKLLRPEWSSPNLRARFERERHVQARLQHPGVAAVLDAGESEDGQPFLVMELVEGLPLDKACAARGLDTRERVQLFVLACDAVQHAHQNGVVHRDLKPSNVYVTTNGLPKLLDFGVAKLLESGAGPDDEDITREARAFYTPSYASPEQVRGETVDSSSDVYSLGVLLYHLLTGRLPLDIGTTSRFEQERAVLHLDPQLPSAIAQGPARTALRGDLDAILQKALRKDRSERYGSAGELAVELRRHLDREPVIARRGQRLYALRRALRSRRVPLALAALTIVSLAALALALRPRQDSGPGATSAVLGAYAQGLAARDRGDYEAAVEHFDAALAFDPSFAAGQLRRAWALLWREHNRDQGETEAALRVALANPDRLDPVDQEKAWLLNELARADFFPTAPEGLLRARDLASAHPSDPEAIELWVEMAFHHQASDDPTEAQRAAERLIELHPRSTSGHLHRFLAAARGGDPDALREGAAAYLDSAVDGMYRGDAALHLGRKTGVALAAARRPGAAPSPQRIASLIRVALIAGDAQLCRSTLDDLGLEAADLDVSLHCQLLLLEGRIEDAVQLCGAPSEDWRIYELRLALGIPMGLGDSDFPRWMLASGLEALRAGDQGRATELANRLEAAHAARSLPITGRALHWLRARLAESGGDTDAARAAWLAAVKLGEPIENIEIESVFGVLACDAAAGLLRMGDGTAAQRVLASLEANRATLHMGQLRPADWIISQRATYLKGRLAELRHDVEGARRAYDAFLSLWSAAHPAFPEIEDTLLRRAALESR